MTTYENLIVLCPNCHTRVHAEKVPSKAELRHYKLKQEIAYALPVLARLTHEERSFVVEIAKLATNNQIAFSKRFHAEIEAEDEDAAVEKYRIETGYLHLEESGMVAIELGNVIGLDSKRFSITMRLRVTGKGVKWLRYLESAGRLQL